MVEANVLDQDQSLVDAKKNACGDIPTSGVVALPQIHVMKVRVIATLMGIVSEAWSVEQTIVIGLALQPSRQIVAQNLPTSVLQAGLCLLEIKCVIDVLPIVLIGEKQTAPVQRPNLAVN